MPPIKLAELEQIIDLLGKYPIAQVQKRTQRSFKTLARIAELHLKDAS